MNTPPPSRAVDPYLEQAQAWIDQWNAFTRTRAAAELLRGVLADGPKPQTHIATIANTQRRSWPAVRQAADSLEVDE